MTRPRSTLIALDSTPYYHITSRCVRRAFLCGMDYSTGESYTHRRDWIVELLQQLESVFAINICAYAVMSNHYHLVLHIDVDTASRWSDNEVLERWQQLFSGHVLVQRFMRGDKMTEAERTEVALIADDYRNRLHSISWFMRILNEPIARQANAEDDCKGRFWEGRFKSQALLDEAAVVAAMAYVDLNPIRANMADTPEASDYTSVQQRIMQMETEDQTQQCKQNPIAQPRLLDLCESINLHSGTVPEIGLIDYLQLVEWTGRAIRNDKRGAIPQHLPPLLQRLGIQPEGFIALCQGKHRIHCTAIGGKARLQQLAEEIGLRWIRGVTLSPS